MCCEANDLKYAGEIKLSKGKSDFYREAVKKNDRMPQHP